MLDARSNTPLLRPLGFKKVIFALPFLRPFFILRQAQDKTLSICRRVFILFTAFVFLFNSVGGDILLGESWAAKATAGLTSVGPEGAGGPTPLKELNAGTFTMPQELGFIQEASSVPGSDRTVIHIQDAHCNYDAQKRIAEILGYLTSEYGINAVNCEGGKDSYDLSVFTSIDENDIRQKVSDFFVKEGVVNAAEFFAVNNPHKAKLWGVEDADLYIKNLKIYRESLTYKDEADRYIKSLGYILDNLKMHIYSPELLEFDKYYTKYKDSKISFKEYIIYLIMTAKKNMIDIKSFPNIYLLGQTLEEEDKINFRKANNEKDEVVDKLKKVLSRKEMEELMVKVGQMKIERISQADFYAYLVKKCRSIKLDLKGYPELEKYIVYISIYSAIDRVRIPKEIDSLEDRIKESLYENDTQRELGILSKNLILEKNMFNISLTRDDYTYYQEHRASFNVVNFTRFIDSKAPLYKIQARLDSNIGDLDIYRERMEAFYKCSLERDKAFVRNIKFTDHGRPNSIIITGGFHTENLRELFKNEKVSYISIMPKFTNPPGYESPYLKRLAGQRTALENVVDSAIPAVLNLAVVNILSTELAIEVEGRANVEMFRLGVLIMTAIEKGQKFILKVNRDAYSESNRPQEDKIIIFNKGEGGNIASTAVSSGESDFVKLAKIANASLTAISANTFEFKPQAEVAEGLARGPVEAVSPEGVSSIRGKEPAAAPEAPATQARPESAPVEMTEAQSMYNEAKSIIPEITQSLRRGAPTYLLSPAISEGDIAPETSNNRTAEQILGKQGHEIHAKCYLAKGIYWGYDRDALVTLLKNTLPDFVKDAQSNPLTRMSIRLISDEKGEMMQEMKGVIKGILIKNYNLSDTDADKMIEDQIRFVPINVLNVQHINTSIDLFTDISMMEIDRYLKGDYPSDEMPVQLRDRFLALLRLSITNYNDIMRLVNTEEDIAGILNAIFRCSIILRIRPVDWKSMDEWKKANDAILKSL